MAQHQDAVLKKQEAIVKRALIDQGINENFQQGQVKATKRWRTGLITKVGNRSVYQPFEAAKRREDSEVTIDRDPAPQEVNIRQECATPLVVFDDSSNDSQTRGGSGIRNIKNVKFIKKRAASKDEPPMATEQVVTTEDVTEPLSSRELPKIKIKNKVAMVKNGPPPGLPFDFKYIKIIVKKGKEDSNSKEVLIDRNWVSKNNNIPHFANVISGVDKFEGVEITMNCNYDAFTWIITYVKIKSEGDDAIEEMKAKSDYPQLTELEKITDETDSKLIDKLDEIQNDQCLNIMVTAYFLQLGWVYLKVWDYFFVRNFDQIINECTISLSNINSAIVKDVANRICDESLDKLTERKDKFISNIFKARIDQQIIGEPDQKILIKAEITRNAMESKAEVKA